MFAKLVLKKIEFDFVTISQALNFWSQGISWNTKAIFYNTCNEKALGTKWLLAFPVALLFVSVTLCF